MRYGYSDSDDSLIVFLILLFVVPALLAPILSFLSFRSPSKVLNVFAWLTSIYLFIISRRLPFGGWGSFAFFVDMVSISLLVTRLARAQQGRHFISATIAANLCYLATFHAVLPALIYVPGIAILFHIFSGAFLLLVSYSFQGWLLYRAMRTINGQGLLTPGYQQPVIWSVVMGLGAFVIELLHQRGQMAFFFYPGYITHFPNIFTDAICWILIGVIATEYNNRRPHQNSGDDAPYSQPTDTSL